NAPPAKLDATRGGGAEEVRCAPDEAAREPVAARGREEGGLTIAPPYADPHVAAGHGTGALARLGAGGGGELRVAPCGGGGLLSGTALAASAVEGCRVVGAEPELADDAIRTFRSGELQRVHNPPTIADGLRTPSLGRVTWPVIRAHVDAMVPVAEAEIV